METHLTDEQLANALAGTPDAAARRHLESCAACRGEQQRLTEAFASLRDESRAAAEHPEMFWQGQRAAIRSRLEAAPAPQFLAWASVAALVALAVLLSLPGGTPAPAVSQADPDRQLMLEVQQTLDREVPDALAPATLLTQEMSQALESNSKLEPHSGRRSP